MNLISHYYQVTLTALTSPRRHNQTNASLIGVFIFSHRVVGTTLSTSQGLAQEQGYHSWLVHDLGQVIRFYLA